MISNQKAFCSKINRNVGILTLYYKSINYGGLLQAYALTKAINNLDFYAKQINYDYRVREKKEFRELLRYNNPADIISKLLTKLKRSRVRQTNSSYIFEQRINKAKEFADSIPHTNEIYSERNIEKLLEEIGIFVVGSDQIWNDFSSVFFLDFVPQTYGKISYAASMSKSGISKKKLKYMAKHIDKFNFVSVRENSAKESLEPFVNKKIHVLPDPTIIIDKAGWHNLAEDYYIGQDYIFVYLLGDNIQHRKRIKEIADLMNLAIVFIPHVHLKVRDVDKDFADYELYDVGPREFVGLIKNASMVITDSFHGCVISSILEKNFWAVKRHLDSNINNMNSRLYTLFESMKIEKRFLEDVNNDEVLLREINYGSVSRNINILRKNSIEQLRQALNSCTKEFNTK